MEDSVLVSLKIPRKLLKAADEYADEYGYSSRTELFREALRREIWQELLKFRGVLQGKVPPSNEVFKLRRKMWKDALKQADGDTFKADEIMDKRAKEAAKRLGF